MRQFIYVLGFLGIIFSTACSGPKSFVRNAKFNMGGDEVNLKKARTNLDSALKYEENRKWAKTWYTLGDYYYNRYKEQPKEEKDSRNLVKAYQNYKKAIQMDEEGEYAGNAFGFNLLNMSKAMIQEGINAFNNEQFQDAYQTFSGAIDIETLEQYPGKAIDTAVVYNTGLAAYNLEKYDTAIYYFDKAKKLNYGDLKPYIMKKQACLKKGDSARAIKTLKNAYAAYPERSELLIQMVNFYLKTDKPREALKYLDKAKKRDTTKAIYLFAEGTLYERLDQKEKAYEAYKQAIEIDPEFFDAYYNLGVLEYNKGVDMVEKANEIDDHQKYNQARKKAEEQLKKALPYLEKAQEIKPYNEKTLRTLKTIYVRLNKKDKQNKIEKLLKKAKQKEEQED